MFLLVGLGNPGPDYANTRHNVGFRVVERVAAQSGIALETRKFGAILGTGKVAGEPAALLLPQTFMNLSGEAVGAAARFWKVDPAQVVVAHDELDLELGRVQLKVGGGTGGHNGLKSVVAHLGPEFVRVRVGIGRPPPRWDAADYVLKGFSKAEEEIAEQQVEVAAEATAAVVKNGTKKAMNDFNKRSA